MTQSLVRAKRAPSSYEERLLAAVSRSTPAEREELLAFRAGMYGAQSPYADPAWVRWLYDEAPHAAVTGPTLWTYRHDARIHGQIGEITTKLRVGAGERDFGWMLDLMVSPAHRARGIGAALPKVVHRRAGAAGGTEVSDGAQKSFARMGWQHLGTLPRWVRPMRSAAFLRGRTDSRLAGLFAAPLDVASSVVSLAARVRTLGRRLAPLPTFDERADRVWQRCAPLWPVIARRDRAWLAWRWDTCPDRRGARAFSFERRGEPLGWVVVRVGEERGLRAGHIVDLLCAPEELDALLALSVANLMEQDVDAVYCLLSAPDSHAPFVANGFLRRDSGWAMMTSGVPAHAAEWFVTSGDSDLDRRRDGTTYA